MSRITVDQKVKVLDFGIAKAAVSQPQRDTQPDFGITLGISRRNGLETEVVDAFVRFLGGSR
jgi:hypothetical protein